MTQPQSQFKPRHYLMARPTYYTVTYQINPWMHPEIQTDGALALAQWQELHDVYVELGHRVDVIDGAPGLPDMVYAANGGLVVDGKAIGANFTYPQRQPETPLYNAWFEQAGFPVFETKARNEGEGDILTVGDTILAGTGFRTDIAAHKEIAEITGYPVVSLELVDPHYYHLDTALSVFTPDLIAYYPPAFSAAAQSELRERFPDAMIASDSDAAALGLNLVSDGTNAIMAPQATGLVAQARERGFNVITVDTSELLKGGGGIKCCTLELRHAA
ncbi:dimethylargininase [Rarobacter incanus]|uniref:N-dimethylarginine dimethylaminohydrolase n=1 Tax=Rarobacter incanus TaxID=153494 RepID=A0A542SPF6_9MICO|nr:dimethylargininase [Rarobacter incanus]TQK76500.1 N-dimethylarginine dimethylaminohydrolase [Rarobacter incanus]